MISIEPHYNLPILYAFGNIIYAFKVLCRLTKAKEINEKFLKVILKQNVTKGNRNLKIVLFMILKELFIVHILKNNSKKMANSILFEIYSTTGE